MLFRSLTQYAMEMAAAMKIPWEDFRWYAAFHDAAHHQMCIRDRWRKVDYSCRDGRETRVYFPPEAVKEQELQALAEDPAIHLRDLLTLGLPDHNVYLVHATEDVGWVPAADLPRLTTQGKEEFSLLLDTRVTAIRPGPYGVELVLDGVDPQMLVRYDEAIANYSRVENALGIFM